MNKATEVWLLSQIEMTKGIMQINNIGVFTSLEKLKLYCNKIYVDESIIWYEAYSTLHKGESTNLLLTASWMILDEFTNE